MKLVLLLERTAAGGQNNSSHSSKCMRCHWPCSQQGMGSKYTSTTRLQYLWLYTAACLEAGERWGSAEAAHHRSLGRVKLLSAVGQCTEEHLQSDGLYTAWVDIHWNVVLSVDVSWFCISFYKIPFIKYLISLTLETTVEPPNRHAVLYRILRRRPWQLGIYYG